MTNDTAREVSRVDDARSTDSGMLFLTGGWID